MCTVEVGVLTCKFECVYVYAFFQCIKKFVPNYLDFVLLILVCLEAVEHTFLLLEPMTCRSPKATTLRVETCAYNLQ